MQSATGHLIVEKLRMFGLPLWRNVKINEGEMAWSWSKLRKRALFYCDACWSVAGTPKKDASEVKYFADSGLHSK